MCFPFCPGKRQHINKFDPHPFPGQSREVVCVYWFFSQFCNNHRAISASHATLQRDAKVQRLNYSKPWPASGKSLKSPHVVSAPSRE